MYTVPDKLPEGTMAEQNNILLINLSGKGYSDAALFCGCHLKIIKHSEAEIYTTKTIANCAKKWDKGKKSWKLHVIGHGGRYGKITDRETNKPMLPGKLAGWIDKSGLPDSANSQVRIDVCCSGEMLDSNPTFAQQVQQLLTGKKIKVSAVPSMNTLGWGTTSSERRPRVVVSSKSPKGISAKTPPMDLAMDKWSAIGYFFASDDWKEAWTASGNVSEDTTSDDLKIIAAEAYKHGIDTLTEYYDWLIEQNKLWPGFLMSKAGKAHKVTFPATK
jgi:hypothetical protein